jgi:hypothetical protein
LPAWGFYARHVANLTFEDVRLTCTKPDQRPVLICDDVNDLTLDEFRFPRFKDVPVPLVLTRVPNVHTVEPKP